MVWRELSQVNSKVGKHESVCFKTLYVMWLKCTFIKYLLLLHNNNYIIKLTCKDILNLLENVRQLQKNITTQKTFPIQAAL